VGTGQLPQELKNGVDTRGKSSGAVTLEREKRGSYPGMGETGQLPPKRKSGAVTPG
jgi:hypothetical protein